MTAQSTTIAGPSLPEQAPVLLAQLAGYVGHRTVSMGLRAGLVAALAEPDAADGLTPDELAERLDLDPFYVAVWCRSAFAAGVCQRGSRAGAYRLAPHMGTLLLDTASPAYVGGVYHVLEQHEMFGRFEQHFASGERLWWDECSPAWIAGVAGTGTPFYTRLIPGGLGQVPGLAERLSAGGRVVDSACGAGGGVVRLAQHYPTCQVIGVDGDEHSIRQAGKRVADAGVSDRVTLSVSPLEELRLPEPATLIINNISMHECRDIDRVAKRVAAALEPGGWFVISDFPFPDNDQDLRSVPGRIMSGIQFFEAQIDDQLLPRSFYDDLLRGHGFTDLGSTQITPMHALTWGRRPN